MDLVNKALDAGVAADAKADDGEVDDEEGVEDKHGGPAASPPAVKTQLRQSVTCLQAFITLNIPISNYYPLIALMQQDRSDFG